ncbi:MAG: ABC transporter permease, partial [Bryobacteraceae bacterium]
MNTATYISRSLRHYWRTSLASALGVATAVAVLAGALLAGQSVRASLRSLVEQRLGKADFLVSARHFFREQLASDLGGGAAPLIVLQGAVINQENSRRAGSVQIYGVDERFWKFHGQPVQIAGPRDFLASEALSRELGAAPHAALRFRVEKPSAIPAESLHGRKDDPGRTVRGNLQRVLPASSLGEFSLQPQQSAVMALFVPLVRLQDDLEQPGKVNAILVSGRDSPAAVLAEKYKLEDLGSKLRPLEDGAFALESDSMLLDDAVAREALSAAKAGGMSAAPAFTYLANSIRANGREIPYSLIAAVDPSLLPGPAGLYLNEWAARELKAKPGDAVSFDYYVWETAGSLVTKSAGFPLSGVLPMRGLGADRNLAPEYPGISDTESLSDWDPPFPMDLGRIRPADEQYWDEYRTSPKAFIPLAEGQKLWASRFGKLTSIRFTGGSLPGFEERLRSSLNPLQTGFTVEDVRAQGLAASRGATDFSEYFTYFSFFLVISALLLAGLFFRFGVQQRLQEIGMLQAVGIPLSKILRIMSAEAVLVALAGSLIGIAGALCYAALILLGLQTWWSGAVGTRLIALNISFVSLLLGAAGGILMAPLFMLGAFFSIRKTQPRT